MNQQARQRDTQGEVLPEPRGTSVLLAQGSILAPECGSFPQWAKNLSSGSLMEASLYSYK